MFSCRLLDRWNFAREEPPPHRLIIRVIKFSGTTYGFVALQMRYMTTTDNRQTTHRTKNST